MKNLLYSLANEYVAFEIAGKTINVPYCITKEGMEKGAIGDDSEGGLTSKYENFAAKGNPQQIREILHKKADTEDFDLKQATADEITAFMIKYGIGVDCSGFVYNVLDKYLRETKHESLDTMILRFNGLLGILERFLLQKNRVRRSSAATLTNDLNSIKIEKVKDMKPGDMIRLTHADWKGKHIALIIDIDDEFVTYAMSSQYTVVQGVHYEKIKILDKNKELEAQQWLENTKKGKNYGTDTYNPARGDSVRRLKYLAENS